MEVYRQAAPPLSLQQVREQSELADYVMRRQLALSLRVAAVFVLLLFGLPLVNLYFSKAANTVVFGFPASWLFLGVLFYPVVVVLSIYFVRHSDAIEADCARRFAPANTASSTETRDAALPPAADVLNEEGQ